MTRLLRTEFARFWGRRIVWVTVGLAGLATLAAFAIAFTQTSSEAPSSDEGAVRAAAATEDCLSYISTLPADQLQRDYPELDGLTGDELDTRLREQTCFSDPAWYGSDDQRFFATSLLGDSFADRTDGTWADVRPDSSEPQTYTIGTEQIRTADEGLMGILPAVATFSLVMSVVIGGSFVGAEYRAGTVENLLLWEPRRVRVLGAKFVAGFVSSAAVTAIVLSWLTAVFSVLSIVHGSRQGVDARYWIDIVSVILRAGLVGGFFFLIAMSVAVIARNTTASVGLILGWFAISNVLIELVAKSLRRWELFTNALAFINEANVPRYQRVQGEWQTVFAHGYLTGGLVALIWVAVIAGVATWVFARRDVD